MDILMENLLKMFPIYVELHVLTPFQTPALPPQQRNDSESKLECNEEMVPKT
jgi:hypothetical protein